MGDGFNAHSDVYNGTGYATNVSFSNCYAHDNMDDGFSWHQYCFSDLDSCLSEYNGSGITPASGGDALITNCIARRNIETGFACVGLPLDGSPNSEMFISNCEASNNGINYISDNAPSKIYASFCTANGSGGGFTIQGVIATDCICQP